MIDSHSEYCGPSPTHLFRILLGNNLKYGSLKDNNNWEILLNDAIEIYNSKIGVWRTQISFNQLKSKISKRSITEILRFIYESEAKANKKTKLFVKENAIYDFIYYLFTDFGDSKYLYLVRDPRDMALSWKLSPNLRGCVIRAGNTWKRDQREYLKIYASLKQQNKAILIRYEDLLIHTEEKLKILCKFLGINYQKKLIEFQNSDLTTKNAYSSTDWRNLCRPLLKKNFNKYKHNLTEEEIKYIECLCQSEMDIMGYKREFDNYSDLETYESIINKLEQNEKPSYMKLPEKERKIRKTRVLIENKIAQRSPIKLAEPMLI
jgi:hypothetical protein